MQIPTHIAALIEKYQQGTITPEESQQLNEWYHSFDDSEVVVETEEEMNWLQIKNRLQNKIGLTMQVQTAKSQKRWIKKWHIPVAAAVLLLSLTALLYWQHNNIKTGAADMAKANQPIKQDIAPGGNKAVLTLADGSHIILDSVASGTISQQGMIAVKKLENGVLAYTVATDTTNNLETALTYNTISTPKGGQYQVTLADGTKVWLNAASSIRFPVKFSGTERPVEITGEAYFEVAKNPSMPFKVKAAGTVIEVLGTHFNINAYTDEATVKTTLLEGKVKITPSGNNHVATSRFLTPGQQALVDPYGSIRINNQADVEEAVAWKNGRFQFNSADLHSILRQIARWYDVDIEYKINTDLHFTGQITRNENVSKVLEKLKLTGEVTFTVEGRKIIVSH